VVSCGVLWFSDLLRKTDAYLPHYEVGPQFELLKIAHCYRLVPCLIPSVSQVGIAYLLSLYLRHVINLLQVESMVASCNQRLYLLAQLKNKALAYLHLIVYSKPLFSIQVYLLTLMDRTTSPHCINS